VDLQTELDPANIKWSQAFQDQQVELDKCKKELEKLKKCNKKLLSELEVCNNDCNDQHIVKKLREQ